MNNLHIFLHVMEISDNPERRLNQELGQAHAGAVSDTVPQGRHEGKAPDYDDLEGIKVPCSVVIRW